MRRTGRAAGLAIIGLVAASGQARAAEPIDRPVATAAATSALPAEVARPPGAAVAPPSPGPAPGDPTARQIAGWIAEDHTGLQANGSADGDPGADPLGPPPPRRIHGQVGVGVGSSGYREAYGAVSLPIGRASEVDLAVADAHAHFRHDGFGRGGGVEQRSLSVGVFLDGGDVARALDRDKCSVPRWGIGERDDPVVNPDGSCARREAAGPKGR